jgi:predicted alpha/beta superfamily hydrolase
MTDSAPRRSPVTRPDAEQWDVASRITGRTYRIYVAKPAQTQTPPPQGYPVVYMTDGDLSFHTAADAVTMLSAGYEARPAMVVGIGYGKGLDAATRTRFCDLTPTPPTPAMVAAIDSAPSMKGATYGEAEGFHHFLVEELRPQIDATYNTDANDNILWGDSLGGLFGLHVLFNHPEAYRTYLIGSPSIVWSDHAILQDEAKLTAPVAAGTVAPRVLLTAGGLEENLADDTPLPPGVTREQMQASLTAAGMITNVVALAGRLAALEGPKGCEVKTVVFDGETHISVLSACINRGLRFALKP